MKTYQKVSAKDKNLTFSIAKMETIFEHRQGKPDQPHRHNYYTVLLVNQANGIHKIDFQNYDLRGKQIYFVSPGQVHQLIENEQSIGFVMTFSTDFLVQNAIPLSFIADLNLFRNYGQTPPLQPNANIFDKTFQFAEEIFSLFHSQQNNKFQSIGAYLKLFLIQCSNACTIHFDDNDSESLKSNTIRRFKAAVEEHYKTEHSIGFYANLLHLTPDHLSRTVKAKLGKTAKEYIQTRIITEAKRLLYFTDLTNKEIGYELGFSEPANFSAFFKKCTQLSPSNFKKQERAS